MYLALRSGKPVKTKTEKGAEINRVYSSTWPNALILKRIAKRLWFLCQSP